MSDELIELEEEEHTSQLTSPVVKRILGLLRPHWKWVVGFMVAIMITSILDAFFTYLNKQIVDVAIANQDKSALMQIALVYGVLQIFQAGFVFTFIYLAGVLGERSNTICARRCSTTCRTFRSRITAECGWTPDYARVTSDTGRVSDL